MKKTILLLIILGMTVSYNTYSQESVNKKMGVNLELGYGLKINSNQSNATQLLVSPFYNFNQFLALGIGAGVMLHTETEPRLSIPIFIHGTYKMDRYKTLNPFFNLKIGYGLGSGNSAYLMTDFDEDTSYSVHTDHNAGLFISPAIGVNYKVSEKRSFSLSVSYELLKIKNESTVSSHGNPDIVIPQFPDENSTISFRIGYQF
jgi:hypothetical protein